jgi:hypothetical protein
MAQMRDQNSNNNQQYFNNGEEEPNTASASGRAENGLNIMSSSMGFQAN